MSNEKNNHPEVVNGLRQVVADTYSLLGLTHFCHWNVEGPGFFALHDAFEQQYTELFTAVDDMAERVRALGAYAPGGLANLAEMAGFAGLPEGAAASEMVEHLLDVNQKLITHLQDTRDAAGAASDMETEDLMVARIQVHEKTAWMLRSYLR